MKLERGFAEIIVDVFGMFGGNKKATVVFEISFEQEGALEIMASAFERAQQIHRSRTTLNCCQTGKDPYFEF